MNAIDVEALRKRVEAGAKKMDDLRMSENRRFWLAGKADAFATVLMWLDELKIPDAVVITKEQIRRICFKATGGWECEECKGIYCPFGGTKEAQKDG